MINIYNPKLIKIIPKRSNTTNRNITNSKNINFDTKLLDEKKSFIDEEGLLVENPLNILIYIYLYIFIRNIYFIKIFK